MPRIREPKNNRDDKEARMAFATLCLRRVVATPGLHIGSNAFPRHLVDVAQYLFGLPAAVTVNFEAAGAYLADAASERCSRPCCSKARKKNTIMI